MIVDSFLGPYGRLLSRLSLRPGSFRSVVGSLLGCECRVATGLMKHDKGIILAFNPRPTGGGLFRAPPSRFLAISSKSMQLSPPNL